MAVANELIMIPEAIEYTKFFSNTYLFKIIYIVIGIINNSIIRSKTSHAKGLPA